MKNGRAQLVDTQVIEMSVPSKFGDGDGGRGRGSALSLHYYKPDMVQHAIQLVQLIRALVKIRPNLILGLVQKRDIVKPSSTKSWTAELQYEETR